MSISDLELSRIIDDIIALGEKDEPPEPVDLKKGKPGRPEIRSKRRDWELDLNNPEHSRSYSLISMCIKEDFGQTLDQLADRVASYKNKPRDECLKVLRELHSKRLLGYYDFYKQFRRWTPNGKG